MPAHELHITCNDPRRTLRQGVPGHKPPMYPGDVSSSGTSRYWQACEKVEPQDASRPLSGLTPELSRTAKQVRLDELVAGRRLLLERASNLAMLGAAE